MKLKLKRAAPFAALLIIALTGCGKPQEPVSPTTTTAATPAAPPVPTPDNASTGPEITQANGIKNDVETALADNKNGVFPKGVKLNSAEIKAGVVTLDFNAAFNQVANSGESGESDVQHELIRIVAANNSATKMRVTVDGKPFDSQATDWNTPFSVRPSAGDADKAADAKAGR